MNNHFPNNWKGMLPNFLGDDFFSSFNQLATNSSTTKVNIYESGNELIVVFSLPGLKVEEVDIYAYERTLEVRGTVHIDFNGFRLVQEEMVQGPIKRSIELPFPVKEDKVDAAYQRGMLVIHLHRLIRPNQVKQKINIKNLDE
ncbi:Hsp20/alpha crystallin family protein [Bacillus alkalicellulosilyticus]|uniref:Hsp20/alpha crystallin family protein n=1 Tax=Alkalihalobacterium alkalicellulosilyticum TaxID=1912214 RepID=UPI001115F431|nr:Hsp20/alpha crystallin family protein [Bacillus alkalicellulosilyticus]